MSEIGINDLTQFTAGTKAEAAEVNNNFSVIKTAHNDTNSRVDVLETTLENDAIVLADGTTVIDKPLTYKKLTITGATNATPIVITANGHGLSTGENVFITGVVGNTAANGSFVVTKLSDNTFSLDDSVGNGARTSGGVCYILPNNLEDLANKAFTENYVAEQLETVPNLTLSNVTFADAIANLGFLTQTIGEAGSYPLPNSADKTKPLIIKWGTVACSTSGPVTVTLPVAFPNNFFGVLGGQITQTNNSAVANCVKQDLTKFTASLYANSDYVARSMFWIAIGN